MQIYVHRNGQQLGPLTEADVRAQLAAGTLSPQDHVWWQGQATWIQLQQSPFAPLPPLPGLGPAATLPSPFPGAPPVSFTVPHSAQSSDFATWSMVCGIFCVFCGLLAAIPAIFFRVKAPNRRVRDSPKTYLSLGWCSMASGRPLKLNQLPNQPEKTLDAQSRTPVQAA